MVIYLVFLFEFKLTAIQFTSTLPRHVASQGNRSDQTSSNKIIFNEDYLPSLQVSMVELHLDKDSVPQGLIVTFAVCTSLVVAVHLVALLVSTCILPHIDAVAESKDESEIRNSPHTRLRRFIELAWIFSTGLGILLFLGQMILLAWVRFNGISKTAAIVVTVILIPVLVLFIVFAVIFYQRLVSFKYQQKATELSQLENDLTHLEDNRSRSSIIDV